MSPFDQARYERLLKGLEVSEVQLSELNLSDRADAEYVSKENLRIERLVRHLPHKKLGSLCELTASAFYPAATQLYGGTGTPFVRCVDCIDFPLISTLQDESFERLPEYFVAAHQSIRSVKKGELVITKVGSPCYASVVHEHAEVALSRTVLGAVNIRDADPYYLMVFLRSYHGFSQLMRQREQTIQFQLTLERVRDVDVFMPSKAFQQRVAGMARSSFEVLKSGRDALGEAENKLFENLGLDTWRPPEAAGYFSNSRDVFTAGRLDAEFFAPRVAGLLALLGRDGLTIADVAPARHDRFTPALSGSFRYIEIGGLDSDGVSQSEEVPHRHAPSRATQYVCAGDVITSTVRPIRRLSAVIGADQHHAVCSSGFVVLQPKTVSPEVLLTYLRLRSVCELMDLHTSATMYPAISEADLLALPIPNIPETTQRAIEKSVQAARQAKARATQHLDAAKRAVEIAIEDSEAAALQFLEALDER